MSKPTACTYKGGNEPCPECPRVITALHMCGILQDTTKPNIVIYGTGQAWDLDTGQPLSGKRLEEWQARTKKALDKSMQLVSENGAPKPSNEGKPSTGDS